MLIKCQKRNLLIKNQQKVDVFYENSLIGKHFIDLLVNNEIIVELKAVQSVHKNHYAQLLHYLKATNYRVGICICEANVRLRHFAKQNADN